MPFTLTMPKLSPTMNEGTITKWRKNEGEFVSVGETLFEVATDKATVEHTALDEGWLKKILIPEGGEAVVNQAIAVFTESKDESIEGYKPEGVSTEKPVDKEKEKGEEPKAVPQKAVGVGMQTSAFALEPLLEIPSLKPSIDEKGRVKASPLAKKLAKEKKLDLTTVQGSGPKGLVTSKDLGVAQSDTEAVFGSQRQPNIAPGSYEEEALTPVRKVIAERLQQAKTFVPHFYVSLTINAEPLVQLRDQLKEMDLKVTFNDFIVKAVALALRKHPEVNSGFNVANNTLVRFKTIDIAIAVSVDEGLITPIVRYADYKNVGQISKEVKHLADKARNGKLQPHEFKGGSFTISNLGMYGVDTFTAIINPPQAAILAVGGILDRPVIKGSKVVPGKEVNLTISADHRVIDGAAAAAFLKTIEQYLVHPSILLVH